MSNILPSKSDTKNNNFIIRKFNNRGNEYLHFTFKNKFTAYASELATKEWSMCCAMNPEKKFVHIWDCQGMSGFDQEAKKIWMGHMKKLISQTGRIILVSDNIFIRGAARLMSGFSKLHLEVYKSYGEMSEKELK